MNLQADKSTRVTFKGFLVDEVGNLLAVNPDLDSRAFRFYEILVPLAVLKVLVRLAAILRSHPSIAGLAVDVTGFRPFSPTRLDLNLRTIHPLLGIIILGLGPDLHPRVQSVVTLDLKRQFKISIFFVCAQKRVGTSLSPWFQQWSRLSPHMWQTHCAG